MNKLSYVLFSMILINAILGMFFFAFFVEQKPITQIRPVAPPRQEQIIEDKENPLIEEVNRLNRQIRTFSSDRIEAKIWTGKIRIKLQGVVKYEKSKNSRMILRSVVGTEADLGSNRDIFWYWGKRDKDKGLKYARHEDQFDTGLKTGLDPNLIMMCLGLDEIETRDAQVIDQGDSLAIVKKEYSSAEKFYQTTFVDKRSKRIKGFVLSDLDNNPIITCDIFWHNGIPAKNVINWHREGQTISIEYYEHRVNSEISSHWWVTPNYQPRRNLAQ